MAGGSKSPNMHPTWLMPKVEKASEQRGGPIKTDGWVIYQSEYSFLPGKNGAQDVSLRGRWYSESHWGKEKSGCLHLPDNCMPYMKVSVLRLQNNPQATPIHISMRCGLKKYSPLLKQNHSLYSYFVRQNASQSYFECLKRLITPNLLQEFAFFFNLIDQHLSGGLMHCKLRSRLLELFHNKAR